MATAHAVITYEAEDNIFPVTEEDVVAWLHFVAQEWQDVQHSFKILDVSNGR